MIHECLDFILAPLKTAAQFGIMMSDPVGSLRYAFTPLAAYIVDVQEAVALSGVAGKTSHVTMANYKQFGDPIRHEPRTASTTLAQLHAIEDSVDPWDLKAYIKEAMKVRLNGVHRPFWRDWALSEPSTFFTPEPLHHWHKMFWDHDANWCIHALGGPEIDFRFSILHPHTGFRQFHEGISKLKQVTGQEHRDIQRYIVALITGAVSNNFLIAICSLMDFRYLAQAPEISEWDCTNIDNALREFHDHKGSIISSGARTGKRGDVIDNWFILKLELMQSVSSNICENGVPMQWTADTTERCHITEIKIPSRSSNNQEFESQICRYLDREEKCRRFDLATAIREASIDLRSLPNNLDHEYPDDDDDLSENPEEPEELLHVVDTTQELLTHIRPVAPVFRAIRRHGNYFELASSLKLGLYPRALLPFRTVVHGNTAVHLSRDPTMKTMSIDDATIKFNIPDLRGALADYLVRVNAGNPIQIGGRRVADSNSSLPFHRLQVWTKVHLQQHSYHPPNLVLPPQTINALPPSSPWPFGRSDVVLLNMDHDKVWPYSGLKGRCLKLRTR